MVSMTWNNRIIAGGGGALDAIDAPPSFIHIIVIKTSKKSGKETTIWMKYKGEKACPIHFATFHVLNASHLLVNC